MTTNYLALGLHLTELSLESQMEDCQRDGGPEGRRNE